MTMPSLRTYVLAARPGFLSVTGVTAVLGILTAAACGAVTDRLAAGATLLLALLTHAAVNLYNDWGDAVGGSDAINTGRVAPFTGGSRFIQEGRLRPAQVRDAAQMLLIVVVGGGVLLVARSGPGLLVIGLAGLLIGWAYSSPRVALMSSGWGELGVVAGWWLVVVGADYVQRHAFSDMAALAGLSPALLIGAVLLIAEFPDAEADAQVGKRTLVVRWGPERAAALYAAGVLGAHAWVLAWWWAQWLPTQAVWALASLPISLYAALALWRSRRQAQRLRPAIVATLAAALVHTLGLIAAYATVAGLR